jgi:hypothetical protein
MHMKKLFFLAAIFAGSAIHATAQSSGNFNTLLMDYYAVKNALVAGDAAKAKSGTSDFLQHINAIDPKTLSAGEQAAFQPIKADLVTQAKLLAAAKDLAAQRTAFAGFSDQMISLVRAIKPTTAVYVDYCPMKKASWLSAEQVIKNPYYGNAMLSCGSVKETIKP